MCGCVHSAVSADATHPHSWDIIRVPLIQHVLSSTATLDAKAAAAGVLVEAALALGHCAARMPTAFVPFTRSFTRSLSSTQRYPSSMRFSCCLRRLICCSPQLGRVAMLVCVCVRVCCRYSTPCLESSWWRRGARIIR